MHRFCEMFSQKDQIGNPRCTRTRPPGLISHDQYSWTRLFMKTFARWRNGKVIPLSGSLIS